MNIKKKINKSKIKQSNISPDDVEINDELISIEEKNKKNKKSPDDHQ